MKFEVTGPKAFPVESEVSVNDLIYGSRERLALRQMRRVTHADKFTFVCQKYPWKAIIELYGVYAN